MKLATWNVYRGDIAEQKAHLDRYSPDIAVLQECSEPPPDSPGVLWLGDVPRQGIGIVGSDDWRVEAEPVREEAGTHVLPARVSGAESFNLLGVWTRKDSTYVRALLKGLPVYKDFINSVPTVITGDFNSSAVWDASAKTNHSMLVQKLYDDCGLVSAYHAFFKEEQGAESRATLYHARRESQPFHIDYCFVPKGWVGRISSVEVGKFEEFEGLSDHLPVVVEIA